MRAFFQRVKYLYDQRANLGLDTKQMRLLERTYDGLVRNGAMLDAAQKAEVIRIETELAKKFSAFSDKVLADEETFILITQEADLAGLPESLCCVAASCGKGEGPKRLGCRQHPLSGSAIP